MKHKPRLLQHDFKVVLYKYRVQKFKTIDFQMWDQIELPDSFRACMLNDQISTAATLHSMS